MACSPQSTAPSGSTAPSESGESGDGATTPTDEHTPGKLPADDPNWNTIQMSDRGWGIDELLASLVPTAREGRCFSDQALVPGGEYTIGEAPPQGEAGMDHLPALPLQTVTLPPFCMDRFEFPNRKGEVPATSVSWADARALCGQIGKRLCREEEWEAACRGTDQRHWAYGAERKTGACHADVDEFAEVEQLAGAGTFPECHNAVGVFDLNGNVSEWVDATYSGPLYPDKTSDTHPESAVRHVLRGGAPWIAFYGQSCLSRHWHVQGLDRGGDDGFRCCADPAEAR